MVSPRTQFDNMNMSGNVSNVPSLLGNMGPSSGISDLVGSKRRLVTMPQQKSQLQPQLQQQNMSVRSPVKPVYEPGTCARRLTHYMYQQRQRPQDNNIQFWRKFVSEFFAPNAKKRLCVSMYANGRQTTGVFPQDVWHCEICNRKPGRGYEATAEVLPRLLKILFESGTIEELLYVDMPKEYQNSSGQIVLDYAKATQQTIFEQFHVVHEGQLRLVFSPDLKICSWEFCARRHEELIPKRLLIPQVSQLGAAAQKYQEAAQNAPSEVSSSELQNNCNMFVGSVRQLAKALETPLVNDVGYTKRYVRCLQISEVVNSMKDLMDYSRESNTGPMESLAKYPRLDPSRALAFPSEPQQPEGPLQQQQQTMAQNSNNDAFVQSAAMQLAPTNGVMTSVSNTLNSVPAIPPAPTTIGIIHQNSINSRQQSAISTANSPYGGNNNVHMPSPSSSNIMPPPQRSPPPRPPALPSSNNLQQSAFSGDTYANESQSSVQKVIQEMMMSSSQLGGGSMMNMGTMSHNVKNVNLGVGGDGLRQPGMVNLANRIRLPVGNNSMNARMGGGLGGAGGFSDFQFNWNPPPS